MTEERRASRCQKDPKEEAIGTIRRLYGEDENNLDLDFILAACEMINTDKNKRLIWMIANKKAKDALLEKWTHMHISKEKHILKGRRKGL